MEKLRVLISGAGIGGPTLAYWLAGAGAKVTIVERAAELRTTGQNVDIRGAGLEVIRLMGLESTIQDNTTGEAGILFVDGQNKTCAKFGVDESGNGQSFTSDTEILRGVLAKILFDATKERVEYVFGDSIEDISQRPDGAEVTFAKGEPRTFDIVVVAEGVTSRTRTLAFGDAQPSPVKPLGMYTTYFSIPWIEADGTWARWYNATGGRTILLRPDNSKKTRALMSIMSSSDALQEASKSDPGSQKKLMRELFSDAGWEIERVLRDMDQADDLYMQQVAQVKTDSWSQGRVVLLGDTGYCPSPISGMGTTVAIVGAYVLAGEIARQPTDHKAAFDAYDRVMRPFVAKVQKLPPGAPAIANPQTKTGIAILYTALGLAERGSRFLSWTGLSSFFAKFAAVKTDAIVLPEYKELRN